MLRVGVGTITEPRDGDYVTPKIRLVKPLGAGGMGSVWLADHEALHTQVVVKFIAADLARSRDAVNRFEREAAAAAQVKSPHVVQILDHGLTESGAPFIVMELLEGRDLADHLEKFGRMKLDEVGEVVAQLCRALARAHERGIVHRDIKPHNIFLCDAGSGELFVKLLDFGIAKGVVVEKLSESTKTGTLVGSPYYMSPEQLVGAKDIDFRTDLWSVGVVAFESMTGTRAFDGETIGALALCVHNDPLPLPSARCDAAGDAVDAWFLRACSRSMTERFASAKEMADALLAAITGDPTRESMTSSGSALARSKKDAMGLAKTVDGSPSSLADSNALSTAGVERAASRARKPPSWVMALSAVALCGVAYGAVRIARGDHEAHVAPATSLVMPPASVASSSTIASITHEQPTTPPPAVSSATVMTSSRVVVVHTSAPSSAHVHASATAIATSAPSATVAHAKPDEDDIK
jgi:serine/threonine-protein kinase